MGKIYKKKKTDIVFKLVTIFKNVPIDEIDEIVTSAKTCLNEEFVRAKQRTNLELFDQQVRTLIEKGYPKVSQIQGNQLLDYIDLLRWKIAEFGLEENDNIPFVVVIPKRFVSLEGQLSLVEVGGNKGGTYKNLNIIKNADCIETPDMPYLIIDVENGSQTLRLSSDNYKVHIEKHKRQALTVEEGLALVTHYPEILKHHPLDLLGSCYEDPNEIVTLWVNERWPWLSVRSKSSILKGGVVSCGARVGP